MRVDGQLVEKPYKSSSKKIRRRQKKAGSMQSAVQRLYDVCKDVFADGGAGVVPPPEDVERIRSVLGMLYSRTLKFSFFFFFKFKLLICLFGYPNSDIHY